MMNREECSKAINDICTRHDCLTMNQQQALGNMLYGYFETGSEEYVNRIPGAKHRPNDPDWMLPPTLDSCSELQSQRIPLSETLTAYAEKLQRIQRYIEKVKLKDGAVEPLQPIPIKKPYSLYQHQVKAYNIALALFGRGARKGGSQ